MNIILWQCVTIPILIYSVINKCAGVGIGLGIGIALVFEQILLELKK